jgi:hypothetical protein
MPQRNWRRSDYQSVRQPWNGRKSEQGSESARETDSVRSRPESICAAPVASANRDDAALALEFAPEWTYSHSPKPAFKPIKAYCSSQIFFRWRHDLCCAAAQHALLAIFELALIADNQTPELLLRGHKPILLIQQFFTYQIYQKNCIQSYRINKLIKIC